jgi:hypothetical protein
MIKNSPSHAQLVAALGARHDSDEIKQLLVDFGIQWSDVKLIDRDTYERGYNSYDEGFGLTFEDIGEVIKTPNHNIGDGPFLLTIVSLWGYEKGYTLYAHLPWKGVNFDSTLEEMQSILGLPIQKKYLGPREPYQWFYENYKISMHWYEGPKKNRAVTYWYLP